MDQAIQDIAMTIGGLIKLGNVSKLNLSTTLIKDYSPPKNTAFELLEPYSEEELTEAYLSWPGNSRSKLGINIKSLLADNPTIDIEVPDVNLDMDKWSLSQVSQIVFLDNNYDDQISNHVESYNILTGKKMKISTKEPPNEYVIVVRESETKYAINNNTKKSYHNNNIEIDSKKKLFTNKEYTVYTIVDYYIPDNFENNFSNKKFTQLENRTNCSRDNHDGKDYIGGFRLKSDTNVEDWLEKTSEFRASVVFNIYNGSTWTQQEIKKVWKLKSKGNFYRCVTWVGCGGKAPIWFITGDNADDAPEIFTWDNSEIASRVIYRWIEIDATDYQWEYNITAPSGEINFPSDKLGIKINSGSHSTKIIYSPKDDLIGDSVVEYCDNSAWPGYLYDTGSFRFTVGNF